MKLEIGGILITFETLNRELGDLISEVDNKDNKREVYLMMEYIASATQKILKMAVAENDNELDTI